MLAALLGMNINAQQFQDSEFARLLHEDMTRAGVNVNSYEFRPFSDTPAPKGYKPFYISHYGRHASRSDWTPKNYSDVIDVLQKAKEEGILTVSGDSLLSEVSQVYAFHDGMDGRLTPKGVEEEKMLADRMFHRYRKVFDRKNTQVRAISSIVPRCIVSMTAFTDRLTELDPELDISWDTGEKFYAYLDNGCPKSVQKKVQHLLDSLDASYVPDTVFVMKELFTDGVQAKKLVPDVVSFERKIFKSGVMVDAFGMDREILRFLPFDAVYKWFELTNMYIYLAQCNSKEFGLERMPLTENLVQDIVDKADEAISGGNVSVDLRFGHDYPAMALCSYLGLEGVGDRLNFEEARRKWFGPFNVSFAVNLQMIFYRNKADDVLVKFLFNEQETRLRGLDPIAGPYYRWSDVKANIKGYLR